MRNTCEKWCFGVTLEYKFHPVATQKLLFGNASILWEISPMESQPARNRGQAATAIMDHLDRRGGIVNWEKNMEKMGQAQKCSTDSKGTFYVLVLACLSYLWPIHRTVDILYNFDSWRIIRAFSSTVQHPTPDIKPSGNRPISMVMAFKGRFQLECHATWCAEPKAERPSLGLNFNDRNWSILQLYSC